jgi:hypothetical protein
MSQEHTILYIDNFSLSHENPMSTLCDQKCNKLRTIPNVVTYNITDNLTVYSTNYDILLLGIRTLPSYKVNKKYRKIIESNMEYIMNNNTFKRKLLLLQDIHSKTYGSMDELAAFINNNNLEVILTFNDCWEADIVRKRCPNIIFHHVPHHIDTSIFKKYPNVEKTYDIILYGDTHPTHYPFRKRLFDLVLACPDIKTLYLTVPENRAFDPDKCEHGLAKKINSARFAISTKSRYNYFLAKYLEIAACGTIVIGDMAKDGYKIFLDNSYIYVHDKMTDDEILTIIKKALSQPPDTNTVDKLHKHIHTNYNLQKYVEKIHKILLTPNKKK